MKTLVRAGIAAAAVLALATGCSDDGSGGAAASSAVAAVKSQVSAPAPADSPAAAPAAPAPEAAANTDEAPSARDPAPSTDVSNDAPSISTVAPETTATVEPKPVDDQGGPCLDPNSEAVQTALNSIGGFVAGAVSAGSQPNCPDLEFVSAETRGGTGSSSDNILFFHAGNFIRPATPRPTAFTEILGSDSDSVTVKYSWLVGDEPLCCPQGSAVIKFMWDGRTVVSDNQIPAEAMP
ncbi:LppP/LprE family lipoprotein [Antrihabitans cavernicola]|uniref:LppP/LprE family lipoprotein n=1 Tax=Antrihabitans cavernicola TaxID=2495913 RepID=A0A5A7SGE3_9NOCA|nr:LppP/LprE family lipoprotein [Spelaeibacter cavernicola]KAA0023747.1 LppP/LprE family lipoprotein [Spelaeibacter cavernicola]